MPDLLISSPLTLSGELAGLVSEAEQALGELNEKAGEALVPLARLLLRSESIASSRVEGLQTGLRDLARAEAKIESGVVPSVTSQEVLANIDAMVLAVDEAALVERFSEKEIQAIHQRLLEGTLHGSGIAGRIRSTQNWIGGNDYNPCGADFVPPPPEDVPRLLDDLCFIINDDLLPPLVQAALVHAQFETIHPFDDGNGRTGRALVHVVLRRRGVAPRFVPPVSVVFANARDRYIRGLTDSRDSSERGVVKWIEYFAASTHSAARLAHAYVSAVQQLQERWRDQLRILGGNPRGDAAAWAVIDALPAHPMISAPVAEAMTGRARSRIYEAIEQLVTAGVLVPLGTGRRNRWWEAVGLLELMEQLEAGVLPVR